MKEFRRHGANVVEIVANDGTRVLFSYDQPVAAFTPDFGVWVKTARFWSRTTSKHVAEWLAENKADAREVTQEEINKISREAQ